MKFDKFFDMESLINGMGAKHVNVPFPCGQVFAPFVLRKHNLTGGVHTHWGVINKLCTQFLFDMVIWEMVYLTHHKTDLY